MKNTTRTISIIFITMIMFVTVPQAKAEIPNMTLKWANFLPETIFYSKVDNYFAQEIEKRTKGKVKIKVYHGSRLGKVSEMPKLVSSGAIEIGNFPPSYFVSLFPMSTALGIPMMAYDTKTATEITECIAKHPLIVQELQRLKLHPFLYGGLPPYRLQAKNEIKTINDLKNMKVRSFGTLFPIVFKSLGMVPINIEPNDVYEGVQRGVVDGTFGSYSGAYQLRIYEVVKKNEHH